MMVVEGGSGGGGFVLGYIFCNTWVIDEVPYIYVCIYTVIYTVRQILLFYFITNN